MVRVLICGLTSWLVAAGLAKVTAERTAAAMQVSESNPMTGLEGRASLLFNLSQALTASPNFFGAEGRPGNIIGMPRRTFVVRLRPANRFLDFLESQALSTSPLTIPLSALWTALIDGLNPIWPSRIFLGGVALGDVWPCPVLAQTASGDSDILVPFHKLTQWLTYSLVEIFQKVLGWHVQGLEDMTGLPEYRNGISFPVSFGITIFADIMVHVGGLLVDLEVLTLKPDVLPKNPNSGLPIAPPSHPAIVEWRAMTVIELYALYFTNRPDGF